MKAKRLNRDAHDVSANQSEKCYRYILISVTKILSVILILAMTFVGCKEQEIEDEIQNSEIEEMPLFLKKATGMNEIDVMSFNIRHDDATDPQSLDERKGIILQVILDNDPDIVGVQELTEDWMETWLTDQLAAEGYSVWKTLTWAYSSPKAIYYKSNRFSRQSAAGFDLSVGEEHRSGHWAILTDNATNQQYFVCNSHWSTASSADRVATANLLIDEIEENSNGLPVIIFGDFNAQPGTSEISTIKDSSGLDLVSTHSESGNTFHGWDATGDHKIDWILIPRNLAFIDYKVVSTSYSGYWPSDHWPIMASIVPAVLGGTNYDTSGISASSNTSYYFADVTGDGKADKIYWNPTYDSGHTRVYTSDGDGTFTFAQSNSEGASTLSTTKFYFADVNGDGKADKIAWDRTVDSGHTRVYLATGGGSFSSTVISNSEAYSTSSLTTYYFADVTGDGIADKIKWNPTSDSGHTRVYVATGSGYFSSTAISNTEGYSASTSTTYYFADVTGDGKADKIYWNPTYDSGHTRVYVATGSGYFSSTVVSNTNGASASSDTKFYFTDYTGDGKVDKIYWNPGAYLGKLKLYRSNGNGTFDDPVYSLRGTSQSLATKFYFADIDGDGQEDQIRWNYSETPGGYSQGTLKNYLAN